MEIETGYYSKSIQIKKDAIPLSDTKHVWSDDDYEEVETYVEYTQEEMIEKYKQFLFDTDYVCMKIIEGVATKEDYKDIIEQREEARNKINELQLALLGGE